MSPERSDLAPTTLSQSPGKTKLLVALPLATLFGALYAFGIMPAITRMLCILLTGYALVGLMEVLLGSSLRNAASRWDQLAGWKQAMIAILVILLAFFLSFLAVQALAT